MWRSGVVNQVFYSVLIAIDDGKSRRGEWHSPGSPEVCQISIDIDKFWVDFGDRSESWVGG